MTQDKPTLYLIDAHGLIYRAHHAMIRNPLFTSKGFNTSAVFGFTTMVMKLLRDRNPEYIAFVFDMKGPTFRHELFDEYKAHRPEMPSELIAQEPYIRDIVTAMNIPLLQHQGFEADDVIATSARKAVSEGFDVIIVTRDKDAFQLICPEISVLAPIKGISDMAVFRAADVKAKFGVTPSQIVDYLSLVGDSSDNVPGVPTIGEKTAIQLLTEYGTLDALFENIESIKREKLRETLRTHRDSALKSRQLVILDAEVPISLDIQAMKRHEYDRQALVRIFEELEFREFIRQLSQTEVRQHSDYHCIDTREGFQELLTQLTGASLICVDVETDSLDPFSANLVGIALACQPHEAYYIPCGHRTGQSAQLPLEDILASLRPILADPAIAKVGHNIKYDWEVLSRYEIIMRNVSDDTMVAAWMLKPERRKHNLDIVTAEYLNETKIPTEKLIGKGPTAITMDMVPIETVCEYACEDVDTTFRLRHLLVEQLAQAEMALLYTSIEIPLIPVLMRMEAAGVKIDVSFLEKLEQDFDTRLKQLEEEIFVEAGGPFNISSPKQLSEVLFEKLQFPTKGIRKTSLGWSTDETTLQKLIKPNMMFRQLPEILLDYRSMSKLQNTYVIALKKQADKKTGRLHTSYNQTVTETGRLSSSDPNLQNIPIRTELGREIRKAFVATDGDWLILSADYSQVELRILAHMANDVNMKRAFNEGRDIHAHTAAEIFGVPLDSVDREQRRMAKTINFGIDYGMTEWGLSTRLNISVDQARRYIRNYFERYIGVHEYMVRTVETAKRDGFVRTIHNRRRYLPEINASNRNVRESAERQAINMPIQGTAAEMIKIAMIDIDRYFSQKKLKSRMIMQVHDELVFEVYRPELDEVRSSVRTLMQNAIKLNIPVVVDMGWGDNWLEAH